MRIAEFVTSEYPYPLPVGVVYAPLDIVAPLANGFTQLGHSVDWFAPENTATDAKVKSYGISPLYYSDGWKEKTAEYRTRTSVFHDSVMLSHLVEEQDNYDVIHLHSTRISLPFARLIKKPVFLTLHNPTNTPTAHKYVQLHNDLKNVRYISISDKQRQHQPDLNYAATIYHGIDVANHPWSPTGGDRWVFIGRIIPEKGLDIAIKLVKELGEGLDIFGPTYPEDPRDWKYFKEEIEPHIDGQQIKYHGSLERKELFKHLATAKCFLFPVHWEEAFGLTVIEALAAGTPTIAFNNGSMPELIEDGVTGFVVEDSAEMFEAMKKVDSIDRKVCRQVAEKRFSTNSMVEAYLSEFEKAI